MDLTVVLEHRFLGTPDGATWTSTAHPRSHWARYLGAFDRVRVLARVERVPAPSPAWQRVDGDGVEVAAIPFYVGPAQLLARAGEVRRAIRAALARPTAGAVILRAPGILSEIAADALRAARRPFGVEVLGDPYEVFAPGSLDHPLRPILRWALTRGLRRVCARASAALYVASVLRTRYPPSAAGERNAFCASDVELGDEGFVPEPRPEGEAAEPFRIVTVGTLEQLYKSPDVLITAVALLAGWGLDVELSIVGDGRRRADLEALAARSGVADRVRFTGRLPAGAAVRAELDRADLFVLPSRTEGMPRALLEAMARALPCLATPVGGIPELLPERALVPPDARALAARIRGLTHDAALRAELSRANLARARAFHEERLRPVRAAFLRALAAATEGRMALATPGGSEALA